MEKRVSTVGSPRDHPAAGTVTESRNSMPDSTITSAAAPFPPPSPRWFDRLRYWAEYLRPFVQLVVPLVMPVLSLIQM